MPTFNDNILVNGQLSTVFWTPADNALIGANDSLAAAAGATVAVSKGTVTMMKIPIRASGTITNLVFGLGASGSGSSTGTFVGVYSSTGSLLSGSSDVGTLFTAAAPSVVTAPITTPQAVTAGQFVWAALLSNLGTTQPSLFRLGQTGSVTLLNLGLTATGYRFCTNGTGTALGTQLTVASNTPTSAFTFWVGYS